MAQPRQIVGISLPPETARAFKAEAERRGIPIRQLFQELWSAYSAPRLVSGADRNSGRTKRLLGGKTHDD